MNKLRYISFLILFSCTLVKGQPVPWTVTTNVSNSQDIVLRKVDSTANYDFQFNTIGDAIGVFFDKSGAWVCGGYIQLDGITKTFKAYGDTGGDNGFQPLEMFRVFYWRKSQNCIIDVTGTSAWTNAQYFNGDSDTIDVLGAFPAIVNYPKEYYCKKDLSVQNALVQITGTTSANLDFNFPAGMSDGSDTATGNIETFGLIISGTYNIPISTKDNMCLRNTSINITISEKLSSSPAITIVQPDCLDQTGKITLDTSTIINGTKPYIIGLKSIKTGNTTFSSSGSFTELAVDNYQLIIQDQYTCADTIPLSILAPVVDCDNVSDIITPLQNSKYAEVFLPWVGLTKVYNSQGQLVHSFTTPAIWDGKDQYGRYVPTGAYFIFTEGKKKKEITVVY